MRRLLICCLLLSTLAVADDCKSKFAVATRSENGNLAFVMSADQQKWWAASGAKKYSDLCLTDDLGKADFLLVWSSGIVDRVYMSSRTTSENTPVEGTGTIINNSGGMETVNVTGTARVERTTTSPVHVDRLQGVVKVCVKAKNQDGNLEWATVTTMRYTKGGWFSKSPTKSSLEDALKLIQHMDKNG